MLVFSLLWLVAGSLHQPEEGGREGMRGTHGPVLDGVMKKKNGLSQFYIYVFRRAGMRHLEETELSFTGIIITAEVMGQLPIHISQEG